MTTQNIYRKIQSLYFDHDEHQITKKMGYRSVGGVRKHLKDMRALDMPLTHSWEARIDRMFEEAKRRALG